MQLMCADTLFLPDKLGCLWNVFTSFLYSLSYLQLADWFDHFAACLTGWLTEWLSDLMLHREAVLNSPFVFCAFYCSIVKFWGREKSLKDGAVNRESLCSLVRVHVRVSKQRWDASLNLLYFIMCPFSEAIKKEEGWKAWKAELRVFPSLHILSSLFWI